jgi:hypothetical protein
MYDELLHKVLCVDALRVVGPVLGHLVNAGGEQLEGKAVRVHNVPVKDVQLKYRYRNRSGWVRRKELGLRNMRSGVESQRISEGGSAGKILCFCNFYFNDCPALSELISFVEQEPLKPEVLG